MKSQMLAMATAVLVITVATPPGPAAADVRPSAPTGVVAAPGDGSATVRWKDFMHRGGDLTQYTITATPGGATATTTSMVGTVAGLANGTAYTFRVTAHGATGSSDPSAPSNAVVPAPTN